MSITNKRRIGKIRIKLAEMLIEAIPGFTFYPEDLDSVNPVEFKNGWDGWSWGTRGEKVHDDGYKQNVEVGSWGTMGDCVRYGIDVDYEQDLMQYLVTPKYPKRAR